MLKTVFTLVFSLNCIFSIAQTGNIAGEISNSRENLVGATVQLLPGNRVTVTDVKGHYELSEVPVGLQKLRISMVGYKPIVKEITIANKERLHLDFTMEEDMLNLEQVVVTATRGEITQYNSPVIVSTISNKTFETTQSLTLSEGLSFSPGLRLENNCQNCGFTQLRMNGLDGSYSQILINSRPVFSALAGVYGLDMIPASMVDRIEVVRGGGSALYGGNAIAGTVNIITKDPIQNSFEIGLNQSFTNLEAPDRTISFNAAIVSDNLSRGISLYGYNRKRDHWDANGDGFSEMTLLDNNTFGFDAFWKTTERSKLKLGLYTIKEFRRGGNDFDLAPHQSDITEQLDHSILGTNLSFEQYSKNYKHKVSTYASAQFVNRDSYYGGGGRVLQPGDSLTAADILAINAYGKSSDISLVGGLQYVYDINDRLILTLGSEYQLNEVIDKMPGYERKIDQKVSTIGSYGQLSYKYHKRLSLLLGGRMDVISIDGQTDLAGLQFVNKRQLTVFVPRLSAMYDINKELKARASYAQGYRAPQSFDEDLHIETVGGAARFISLSENLSTERSNSYTISLNYGKTVGKTQVSLVAEGFITTLNNPFLLSDQRELPSGISVITKRNGSGASVQGVNLEANFAFTSKLIVQSGATFQSATFNEREVIWSAPDDNTSTPSTTSTNNILRTPDTYGYCNSTYSPTAALSFSYSAVYSGSMLLPHVINPKNEYTIIERSQQFLEHNLKVGYTIEMKGNYKIKLFGGMQNIFNAYQKDFDTGARRDAGYIYGPNRPRTVFFGLKLGLN